MCEICTYKWLTQASFKLLSAKRGRYLIAAPRAGESGNMHGVFVGFERVRVSVVNAAIIIDRLEDCDASC